MAVFSVNFLSDSLGRTVPVQVILPTDKMSFDGSGKPAGPFRTLYLLHGIIGDCGDWLKGTAIERFAMDRDLAVVMPSGENGFYVDQPWNCTLYSKFIGEELVDFTRRTFPLSDKKEDTFIGGLSMGGYGALYNGLKYAETFGSIIALSSALILDEDFLQVEEHPRYPSQSEEYKHSCFGPDLKEAVYGEKNPRTRVKMLKESGIPVPAIYMACGDKDGLYGKNLSFSEFLREEGIEHTFEVGPGFSHEWEFWDQYIRRALDWLPLHDAVAGMSSGNVGIA